MDSFFDGDDGLSCDRENDSSSQGGDATLSSQREGDASSLQLSGKKRRRRGKGKRGFVAMKKVIDARKNGIKIQQPGRQPGHTQGYRPPRGPSSQSQMSSNTAYDYPQRGGTYQQPQTCNILSSHMATATTCNSLLKDLLLLQFRRHMASFSDYVIGMRRDERTLQPFTLNNLPDKVSRRSTTTCGGSYASNNIPLCYFQEPKFIILLESTRKIEGRF